MQKPEPIKPSDLQHPKGEVKAWNGDKRKPRSNRWTGSPDMDDKGFTSRGVTVTEGTKPQSRSKLVEGPHMGLDNKIHPGNIHRNTVREYKHPDYNHAPYTSVHRPAPPSEPFDPPALKAHQEAMLSPRQKKANKSK